MHAFPAALMRLICTFFPWHRLSFFLYNIFSGHQRGTIPAVCERAAKVRKDFWIFCFSKDFFGANFKN